MKYIIIGKTKQYKQSFHFGTFQLNKMGQDDWNQSLTVFYGITPCGKIQQYVNVYSSYCPEISFTPFQPIITKRFVQWFPQSITTFLMDFEV